MKFIKIVIFILSAAMVVAKVESANTPPIERHCKSLGTTLAPCRQFELQKCERWKDLSEVGLFAIFSSQTQKNALFLLL